MFLEVLANVSQIESWYHIYRSIQTLYSVLCCLGYYATSLAPLYLGSFSFFCADPLKLCWGASLHSYFQVSPEMFDQVEVRALAGPLKDLQKCVPKPLLNCLGCVLRVLVLLEGEPSSQSEVLSSLEQVFIKDLSVSCAVHLSLDPD